MNILRGWAIMNNKLNNKLIVQVKNIYGIDRIYPVCEKSKSFSRIAGLKTLQQPVIDEIKKLGYQIETKGEKL